MRRKEIARWNEGGNTQQFIQLLVDHKSEGGNIGRFKNKKPWTRRSRSISRLIGDMGVVKEAKHLHTKLEYGKMIIQSWSDHTIIADTRIVVQDHLSRHHHLQGYHIWNPLGITSKVQI